LDSTFFITAIAPIFFEAILFAIKVVDKCFNEAITIVVINNFEEDIVKFVLITGVAAITVFTIKAIITMVMVRSSIIIIIVVVIVSMITTQRNPLPLQDYYHFYLY